MWPLPYVIQKNKKLNVSKLLQQGRKVYTVMSYLLTSQIPKDVYSIHTQCLTVAEIPLSVPNTCISLYSHGDISLPALPFSMLESKVTHCLVSSPAMKLK